ncbi:tyrosine-protein phosphatase [[Clostridium] aminophilum]|uniref:LysM domain-containing protein n=1 Tax=[Clostridium] aminophilum TaxID=1526 RepID=A0A1I6KEL6_9FIRM|nr:tyrosine-protein phosphatase [[Clostridium] aminophilum]SFR89682.1 LysM domain-containing protein [[Clostridium] aminophilum]
MKQMCNAANVKKRLLAMLSVILIIFSLVILPSRKVSAANKVINTTASVANIQKYGNVVLDIKCSDFLSSGYEFGDILKVNFLNQNLKLPLCSNYSDVDSGTAGIFVRQEDEFVLLAINMKDFATTYGIATKKTAADNSVSWQPADGATDRIEVSISMDTKGGYYGEYLLHQLSYTTDRSDYPNLSDAQFANFREVTTSGIRRGRLYRSASPINPKYNRNIYADAAIRQAHVTTIMNLADDPETVASYPDINTTYYSHQNYIALNMGVDFEADDFKQKLANGLKFFISDPGVYLVHCTEGKDRAGFVVAVLECLMGAAYDEVTADYMTTFYNYYGITTDDERYNSILTSNLEKTLKNEFGVENLRSADLSAEAAEYLKSTGLTNEEIDTLKKDLSETATALSSVTEIVPDKDVTSGIYVVKPGDTLSKIAKEKYGDSKDWTYIYELNKNNISNPDIIYIGQNLKLAN